MRKLLTILMMCLFSGTTQLQAQADARAVFRAIQQAYVSAPKMQYRYVIEDYSGDTPDEKASMAGVFYFDGENLYRRLGQEELIMNHEMELTLQHDSKEIRARKANLKEALTSPLGSDPDAMFNRYESVNLYGASEGRGRLEFTFSSYQWTRMELVYRTSDWMIERITLYEKVSMGPGIKPVERPVSAMIMTYLKADKPAFKVKKTTDVVLLQKGVPVLKSAYSQYKLLNQN